MNGPEKFKSFGELGAALKKQNQEQEDKEIKELFDRALKDGFDTVPNGQFKSGLSGIESISMVSAGEGKEKQIMPVVFYKTKGGKEAHSTWVVNQNGNISGDTPPYLNLDRAEVTKEILKLIELINTGFWLKTKMVILPNADKGLDKEPGEGGEKEPAEHPVDPERLPFLENQKDALFGFANEQKGFDGYFGIVFPGFIVLDNERKGNAFFVLDLEEKIEVAGEDLTKPPALRVSHKEKESIADARIKPILERALTKSQLRALGAERIVHTPNTWKEKIQEAINKRLSKP